jgi:hypothetical protein
LREYKKITIVFSKNAAANSECYGNELMAEGIEDYLGSILFTPELAC